MQSVYSRRHAAILSAATGIKIGEVMLEILTVRFSFGLIDRDLAGGTRSAVVWLLVRFVSVLFPGGF